ncbi:hypothetical protein Droror1_Dr00012109 [Drosera rotundifolia]
MVLWELTVATAYFLGLKRTYRLTLRIQRRVISPKRPKIRQFLQRRTRVVFDVAAKVHQNIQQRDIEVGRNLGNWILRWLDRIKPSANIRGKISSERPSPRIHANSNMNKSASDTQQKTLGSFRGTNGKSLDQGSDRLRFSTSTYIWPKRSFPTIAMILRRAKPVGAVSQFRQLQIGGPEVVRPSYGRQGFDQVIRKDIWDWMHRC